MMKPLDFHDTVDWHDCKLTSGYPDKEFLAARLEDLARAIRNEEIKVRYVSTRERPPTWHPLDETKPQTAVMLGDLRISWFVERGTDN